MQFREDSVFAILSGSRPASPGTRDSGISELRSKIAPAGGIRGRSAMRNAKRMADALLALTLTMVGATMATPAEAALSDIIFINGLTPSPSR